MRFEPTTFKSPVEHDHESTSDSPYYETTHPSSQYTLYDSHRTGTTEVVQAFKSVEENIEDNKEMKIWDQKMYL